MRSIDGFLDRGYRKGYDCLNFTQEVWLALTDEDIAGKLERLLGASADRKVTLSAVKGFQRLSGPSNPCLAVMQRPRSSPHIGIFLEGRILHLTQKGVQFQPLVVASVGFATVKYYR